MLRSVASKVAWVGRTASMVLGLALVLALLVGVASVALAGTGAGATFNLGVKNTVNAVTELVSTSGAGPNGPMLRVDNNGTGAAATGVEILTEAGKPPMKVNRPTRVANLNADRLDGKDSADFSPALYFNSNLIDHSSTTTNAGAAVCESGDKAVSGGFELIDQADNVWKNAPGGDRWTAAWRSSDGSTALGGTVYVICADVA